MLRYVHRVCPIAIALLCACGGTSVRTDVYVAGYVNNGAGLTATLWTNGNPVALTAEPQRSVATAVTVSEIGDVYVAGCASRTSVDMAVYWKNGVLVALTDGTRQACAEAIAISGGHVYAAGYETYRAPVATFWRDGIETLLTDGTSLADAVSIAVSGGDVHIAGYQITNTQVAPNEFVIADVARYWKNGVATALTDGKNEGVANYVALSGRDVYVAGWEGAGPVFVAKVWKNGAPVALTDGALSAKAMAVTLRGSDVLAVGAQSNGSLDVPTIWTNGSAARLGAKDQAFAEAIAIAGNDVFVAGYDGASAVYWKNGIANPLTHGSGDADAASIAVYQH